MKKNVPRIEIIYYDDIRQELISTDESTQQFFDVLAPFEVQAPTELNVFLNSGNQKYTATPLQITTSKT
jgi:hypothetical protein